MGENIDRMCLIDHLSSSHAWGKIVFRKEVWRHAEMPKFADTSGTSPHANSQPAGFNLADRRSYSWLLLCGRSSERGGPQPGFTDAHVWAIPSLRPICEVERLEAIMLIGGFQASASTLTSWGGLKRDCIPRYIGQLSTSEYMKEPICRQESPAGYTNNNR